MIFSDFNKKLEQIIHPAYKNSGLPPMIFITDHNKITNINNVINNLPKNSMVIIRDYNIDNRENYAFSIANICRKCGIKFLVAGDVKLARKIGADGVHLPEYMISEAEKINDMQFISVSCHNIDAIKNVGKYRVNAILLSPVFPTTTHPNTNIINLDMFKIMAEDSQIPVYALGGINEKNIKNLVGIKIAGIAGIDVFNTLSN